MEINDIISGLVRCEQVSGHLEINQTQMCQFVLDLDALDSTLHLFKPDAEIGVVRTEPIPHRHAAVRRESIRLVFTTPKKFPKPMTTRAIARAVVKARGMNTADHAMVATMVLRLASMLRKLKGQGRLVADKQDGR